MKWELWLFGEPNTTLFFFCLMKTNDYDKGKDSLKAVPQESSSHWFLFPEISPGVPAASWWVQKGLIKSRCVQSNNSFGTCHSSFLSSTPADKFWYGRTLAWINIFLKSHMSRVWPMVALSGDSGSYRSWVLMESFKVKRELLKGLWDLRSFIIFCCFLYIEVKSLFGYLQSVPSTIGLKQWIFLILDQSLQNRETHHGHKPLSLLMS